MKELETYSSQKYFTSWCTNLHPLTQVCGGSEASAGILSDTPEEAPGA